MNARAKQKEKRKAARQALQSSGTDEKATAAVAAQLEPEIAELTVQPKFSQKLSWAHICPDSDRKRQAELDTSLQGAFAAALSHVLESHGRRELDEFERALVSNILGTRILPVFINGIGATRQVQAGPGLAGVAANLEWEVIPEGAPMHDFRGQPGAQKEPQQVFIRAVSEPEIGTVPAQCGHAAGATDVPAVDLNKARWEAALATAQQKGGTDASILLNAKKIYRMRKKRANKKQAPLADDTKGDDPTSGSELHWLDKLLAHTSK